MRSGLIFIAILLAGLNAAKAKQVTLTAVADCVVRKDAPDTSFADSAELTAFKADAANQAYFLWQFELPSDCPASSIEASTFTFKNVLVKKQQTVHRGAYIYIIKDAAEIAAGDLNGYTFNTAPGVLKNLTEIAGTAQTDAATSAYSGYGLPTAVEGAEWIYTPTGAYLTTLAAHLAADTNGKLTFLFHPRYGDTVGDLWASIENTLYHGPQIVISYTSDGAGIGINVEQPQDGITLLEGGAGQSYTVVLDEVPEYDVRISLNAGGLISVEPSQLVFTQQNWSIPQAVYVGAVDNADDAAVNLAYAAISHTVSSDDVYYNAVSIADIVVEVYDDEGVCDGVEFIAEDIAADCRIDILDMMSLMEQWLHCTDPAIPEICE